MIPESDRSSVDGPFWTDILTLGGFGVLLYHAPHMTVKLQDIIRQVPPVVSNWYHRASETRCVQAFQRLNQRRRRGSMVRLLATWAPEKLFGPASRIYIPQVDFKRNETIFALGEDEDPQDEGVIIAYANNTTSTEGADLDTELGHSEKIDWKSNQNISSYWDNCSPIEGSCQNLVSTPKGRNRQPLRSHLFESTNGSEEFEEMKRMIDILQGQVQLLLKEKELTLMEKSSSAVTISSIVEKGNNMLVPAPAPPPPLPPPPPPPLPMMQSSNTKNPHVLKLKTKNPGDSLDQASNANNNGPPKIISMSDVLKGIGTVKLRVVNLERSPNGTPLKRKPAESSINDHQSMIANALKKRFACIQNLDDSDSFADKENTGVDSDDSFNTSIPSLKHTPRRSITKPRCSIEKNTFPLFGQHLLKKRVSEIEKKETESTEAQPFRVFN